LPTAAIKVRYSAAEERTIETSLPVFFSNSCLPSFVYQKASHQFGLERLLYPVSKEVVIILDIPHGKSFFINSKTARVMGAVGRITRLAKRKYTITDKCFDCISLRQLFPALL